MQIWTDLPESEPANDASLQMMRHFIRSIEKIRPPAASQESFFTEIYDLIEWERKIWIETVMVISLASVASYIEILGSSYYY